MADPSPYADKAANLRDNVKLLVAGFGGIAGVLLAGTPFTGYSAQTFASRPWIIATVALVVALGFLAHALWTLLEILAPGLAYADTLRDPAHAVGQGRLERAELDALREQIRLHGADLYGPGIGSYADLEAAAEEAYHAYTLAPSDAAYAAYNDWNERIQFFNDWAAFVRLHARIRAGTRALMIDGIFAIGAILAFTTSVGSAKADDPRVIVVNERSRQEPLPAPSASPSTFAPVRFETDGAELDAQALRAVAIVRDHLRSHPRTGLLIYAYTDTRGRRDYNAALAGKRAAAVVRTLVEEGGIARARLFTSTLAQSDLPTLTAPNADTEENRAVELVVVDLPDRGGTAAPGR